MKRLLTFLNRDDVGYTMIGLCIIYAMLIFTGIVPDCARPNN